MKMYFCIDLLCMFMLLGDNSSLVGRWALISANTQLLRLLISLQQTLDFEQDWAEQSAFFHPSWNVIYRNLFVMSI